MRIKLTLCATFALIALWNADPDAGLATLATTTRLSVASDGSQANSTTYDGVISGDGQAVAFESEANNLVPDDTNLKGDIFVRELTTGLTERISVSSSGAQSNAFSTSPHISSNARFVAFTSAASNLVANDTNNAFDVFRHDRETGETIRVSVDNAGNQLTGYHYVGGMSADGRYISFHNTGQIHMRDVIGGSTELISMNTTSVAGNAGSTGGSVSADGRFVAFESLATDLTPMDNPYMDVFVRDRLVGVTELISVSMVIGQEYGLSTDPKITSDGRFVVFTSNASNLVPGDDDPSRDSFVRDRQLNTTVLASVGSNGAQILSESYSAGVSQNGRFVTFSTDAPNVVPDDTNGKTDIFLRDIWRAETNRASVSSAGSQANDQSYGGSLTSDGGSIGFVSFASNLTMLDTNGTRDFFVQQGADFDDDGSWDGIDNCPAIANAMQVDSDQDTIGDSCDNCPSDPNHLQLNSDDDAIGDACDADDDNDLLPDVNENACDANALSSSSVPERIDTPADDDGDTIANEPLPPGAEAYDCDGDGYKGTAEANVATSDQDPCGATGWPSDLVPGGIQPNTLNIADIGSFVVPVRRFGTSTGDTHFNIRWDLSPGSAVGATINLQDVVATLVGASGHPPMFGGTLRAFGKTCPWAP